MVLFVLTIVNLKKEKTLYNLATDKHKTEPFLWHTYTENLMNESGWKLESPSRFLMSCPHGYHTHCIKMEDLGTVFFIESRK
jgi:hypothetical protein